MSPAAYVKRLERTHVIRRLYTFEKVFDPDLVDEMSGDEVGSVVPAFSVPQESSERETSAVEKEERTR